MNYPKFLQSVDNPEKLSRTLESLGRLALAIGTVFGVEQSALDDAIKATILVPTAIFGAIHTIRAAYGLWRKVIMLKQKSNQPNQ